VLNLRDWQAKFAELEANPNPFSVVILAQLIAHKTHKQHLQRKDSKFKLVRLLYERGYERQEILELFRFIDWMLKLPKELESQLSRELILIEEEQKMRYVTNIERFAEERGMELGEARGEARGEVKGEAKTLFKLLKLKFGNTPEWVEEKVISADKAQLDQWVEGILMADSIEGLLL
jgi:predicted transposase YdaD